MTWRRFPLPAGWKAIQKAVIQRDPYCQWGSLISDLADGLCGAPSTDADHIGDPNNHSLLNLRGLCHAHHMIRTGRQAAAGRAVARQLRPRKRPQPRHPAYKKEEGNAATD
jgi:5-methylcytosine-specific restriction enzyme A